MKNLSGIRRLGIVGGTFNPIHLGHLRSAEEVREAFDLQRVIFIVSAVPPHKTPEGIIDTRHRYTMVRRALKGNPTFDASDLEIDRKGKSYTVDTLSYFRRRLGAEADIFFVLGLDAFSEIGTWKDYDRLFELADFVVTDRPTSTSMEPGWSIPPEISELFSPGPENSFVHAGGKRLFFYNITGLDISATRIRGLVREGRSIRYLVPEAVSRYIQQKGLYR